MKIYLILLLVFTHTCKENSTKGNTSNKTIYKQNKTLQDSLEVKKNILLTKENAVKTFGNPIKQEKILLSELYGEFSGNIYYKYTEKERQGNSIYIEEITWEKDSINNITIWYEIKKKELIPKAYLIWDKQSEF